MAEIEVKVLDVDPDDLRRKLLELGAVLVKKGREVNQMFDFPDGGLHQRGGYIRIRAFEGKSILTFKERLPTTGFKESHEHETEVRDAEATRRILEGVGLVLGRTDEKDRESYRLGEILFELDHWPTFPPYLGGGGGGGWGGGGAGWRASEQPHPRPRACPTNAST
ncbi:MAG: class IV adenylate cyclase [Candidatus Riflebacteria bacterium]|nr:class IV adenylate cyclase [Candidatus Riflebacteria bacterium]